VAKELKSLKVDRWQQLGLQVRELDGDQVDEVQRLRREYEAPSIKDLFALVLARDWGTCLITRDGDLRTAARDNGVQVRDTLWLIDQLVREDLLSPAEAANALEQILNRRKKFPQAPSWRRIKAWRGL